MHGSGWRGPGKVARDHGGVSPILLLCWFHAVLELLDVGDLEQAQEDTWDRVAFLTRYGGCTLKEALVELDHASSDDYGAAVGRLIKAENAKRD